MYNMMLDIKRTLKLYFLGHVLISYRTKAREILPKQFKQSIFFCISN